MNLSLACPYLMMTKIKIRPVSFECEILAKQYIIFTPLCHEKSPSLTDLVDRAIFQRGRHPRGRAGRLPTAIQRRTGAEGDPAG